MLPIFHMTTFQNILQIIYIEDTITYSDELAIPVFHLKDLTELYSIHNDGMIIAKAAFVLRKQLFNNDEIFNGGLTREQQMASIPQVLHQLIKLLSEGGTCNDNTILLALQILQMISQLIRYDAVKHQRLDPVTYVRHSSSNQPPLPVAVGLMVSMRTSKKSLVNQLTHEDLSISYEPIKSIQRCINSQLCSKYFAEDMVCPPKLQVGLFTSAGIDNIDLDQSSATARTSFPGTSITIFQHTDHPVQNVAIQYDMNNSITTKRKLPSYYTDIDHSE